MGSETRIERYTFISLNEDICSPRKFIAIWTLTKKFWFRGWILERINLKETLRDWLEFGETAKHPTRGNTVINYAKV